MSSHSAEMGDHINYGPDFGERKEDSVDNEAGSGTWTPRFLHLLKKHEHENILKGKSGSSESLDFSGSSLTHSS